MKSVLRNGEYLIVEKTEISDVEVPVKPHENAVFQNGEWVLDIDKLLEKELSKESLQFLNNTDWKILRHLDQLALNIETSLSDEEYQALLQQRQEARKKVINDIID